MRMCETIKQNKPSKNFCNLGVNCQMPSGELGELHKFYYIHRKGIKFNNVDSYIHHAILCYSLGIIKNISSRGLAYKDRQKQFLKGGNLRNHRPSEKSQAAFHTGVTNTFT